MQSFNFVCLLYQSTDFLYLHVTKNANPSKIELDQHSIAAENKKVVNISIQTIFQINIRTTNSADIVYLFCEYVDNFNKTKIIIEK